ncbi:MAG: DEAD/DEAH box helicase, partial [Chloroflexi bacterium UTCFX4]
QRIEQRIGRCHRYGQKHDVVVVNFLNRKNQADQRVFELLSEKFQLFEGVFGASDEVLGAIESGVDFEKRILEIYQRARLPHEIQAAFDQLQAELSTEINATMTRTRQQLLENFDDEVREKLRVRDAASKAYLNRYEQMLMQLTRHELGDAARFADDSRFFLERNPFPQLDGKIPLGWYELPRRSGEAHLYRLNHPLAEAVLAQAKQRELPSAEVTLQYSEHEGKVTILQTLVGQAGWLSLSAFSVHSLDQSEDYLLFAGATDAGQALDTETAQRLLTLPGHAQDVTGFQNLSRLGNLSRLVNEIQQSIRERNARFFEQEAAKLDSWADDLKLGLERDIKELDRQIKEARRAATTALTLEDKLEGQKQIRALETLRNQKRRALFDAQDEVDKLRERLIAQIEGKLKQTSELKPLFTIRWRVI